MKKMIFIIFLLSIFLTFESQIFAETDCEVCGKWIWMELQVTDFDNYKKGGAPITCVGELNVYQNHRADFTERCSGGTNWFVSPAFHVPAIYMEWRRMSAQVYYAKLFDADGIELQTRMIIHLSPDKNMASIVRMPAQWEHLIIAFRDQTGKGTINFLNEIFK